MQSVHQPSVLVLGHSFVWRLDKFITESSLSCVTPNFQLPLFPKVQFSSIGGRTVTKLLTFDLPVVNRSQPRVIILEIGSNDLCIPNCNANDLANTIFHFSSSILIIMSIISLLAKLCCGAHLYGGRELPIEKSAFLKENCFLFYFDLHFFLFFNLFFYF